MILEVAEIQIDPAARNDFEAAITRGLESVIARMPGVQGWQVQRCLETPGRYLLQIRWATLEDHTVGFRQSPQFAEWRAIVGPFFAQPPRVEHFSAVTEGAPGQH